MIWADENNSKAIQQIETVGQSNNLDNNVNATDAGKNVYLNNFKKKWRNEIKISKGRVTVLWNHEVVSVKLKNIQQNKFKYAAKIRLKHH